MVTEVILDLSHNHGDGESGQLISLLWVVLIDRFEQADGAHLDQVIHGLAQVLKPAAQPVHQRQVLRHQLVPESHFPGFQPQLKEFFGSLRIKLGCHLTPSPTSLRWSVPLPGVHTCLSRDQPLKTASLFAL